MPRLPFCTVVGCLLLIWGCAGLVTQPPLETHLQAPEGSVERQCARFLNALDQAVATAGVADGEVATIPGFPYLRVDRFLASFRAEVTPGPVFEAWVDRLQALAEEGRRMEIANLPQAQQLRLTRMIPEILHSEGNPNAAVQACGDRLRAADLRDGNGQALLRARAYVPSDYRLWQRVIGLYPLTALLFRWGIYHWHRETRAVYAQPLSSLPIRGRFVRFVPPSMNDSPGPAEVAAILERSTRNPLRIPEPSREDRERLFAANAPSFEVDVVTADDRFGTPQWTGALYPTVNATQPTVYRRLSYTRVNGQTLLQLNYTVWFSARPKTSPLDLLGGRFDGITWRVTLTPDGHPWVYDTIHNCGCYHLFFPTHRARRLPQPVMLKEPAFVPQEMREIKPGQRPILRIATRTHYIERIAAEPTAEAETVTYYWGDYNSLRSLPSPQNGQRFGGATRRSLFQPDGLVPGSERAERFLFWPMGIPSSGAQRQWGHHATAFVGRRHFDDPALLGRAFELLPQNKKLSDKRSYTFVKGSL